MNEKKQKTDWLVFYFLIRARDELFQLFPFSLACLSRFS